MKITTADQMEKLLGLPKLSLDQSEDVRRLITALMSESDPPQEMLRAARRKLRNESNRRDREITEDYYRLSAKIAGGEQLTPQETERLRNVSQALQNEH